MGEYRTPQKRAIRRGTQKVNKMGRAAKKVGFVKKGSVKRLKGIVKIDLKRNVITLFSK